MFYLRKPIIGLTPQYDYERNRVWIGPNYLNSIVKHGGIPLILPLEITKDDLEILASTLDGFLFTGGPDIDPMRFGEEPVENYGVIVPMRDKMEEDLFHIALASKKPMLGICRGMQLFNVFLGGTLFQDIKEQCESVYTIPYSRDQVNKKYHLAHYQKSDNHVLTHSIKLFNRSKLYELLQNETIRVNSFHHQSVKDLATSLIYSAIAPDSIIEGIEMPNHKFFVGVQWHPEHLSSFDENAANLFNGFINACSN